MIDSELLDRNIECAIEDIFTQALMINATRDWDSVLETSLSVKADPLKTNSHIRHKYISIAASIISILAITVAIYSRSGNTNNVKTTTHRHDITSTTSAQHQKNISTTTVEINGHDSNSRDKQQGKSNDSNDAYGTSHRSNTTMPRIVDIQTASIACGGAAEDTNNFTNKLFTLTQNKDGSVDLKKEGTASYIYSPDNSQNAIATDIYNASIGTTIQISSNASQHLNLVIGIQYGDTSDGFTISGTADNVKVEWYGYYFTSTFSVNSSSTFSAVQTIPDPSAFDYQDIFFKDKTGDDWIPLANGKQNLPSSWTSATDQISRTLSDSGFAGVGIFSTWVSDNVNVGCEMTSALTFQ
jgi:hypothetical protein